MPNFPYNHILLKLSGEALMGDKQFGIDLKTIQSITKQIEYLSRNGQKISIVVGGGNIFRGISANEQGMDRTSADYTGMMATVINALILQSCLEKLDISTRVMSAIKMDTICEPYIRRRAIRHLEKKRLLIFAAGTGNPYFTTDTAAALRASEMRCDAIFKATKVDGIYSEDPKKNKNAKRFTNLSYNDVIKDDLKIMDTSAISLSKENNIAIVVFSILDKDALIQACQGKGSYTVIE